MAAQTEDKKLDGAGLSVLWGLIKNIIPTVPTNVSSFTNDAAYVSLLDTHNQNLVLASPNGASGLPSFRALAASDIPDLSGTYLTSHQSIYGLTLQGDGTTVSTFTPNTAALTFNIKAGSNISLTRGTNEITIAGTDTTYTIATGDANGQIKVTPSSGSAYNVSVKGLGDRAFDSTSYLPLSGGTMTGALGVDVPLTEETVPLTVIKRLTNHAQGTTKDVAHFFSSMGSSTGSHMNGVGARVKIGYDGGKCGVIQWVGTSSWANTGRLSFINIKYGGTEVEALSILDNGNVGIGTESPSQKLHVTGGQILVNPTAAQWTTVLDGFVPSLSAGQAVAIRIGKTDSRYNSGGIRYYHVADGSSNNYLSIDMYNAARVLTANCAGNVGIGMGETAPSYKLQVSGAVGATAFTNTSDIRNKDFISDTSMSIEQIANAPSFLFKWKTGDDKNVHAGSSAQYWQTVLPEIITAANDEQRTLSMQYDVIALLSAITIAKEVVNDKERIRQLEQRVSQLEAQLAN